MAKNPGLFQMAETLVQAILEFQPQDQWLKDNQARKRGQVLGLKFQFRDFIRSTGYLAFAILHLKWPPATGILVYVQTYFTQC